MIYGIAGTNASGKDLLAEYLRDKHGFTLFHTSNFIREEAQKRYGDIMRPTLFKVGNELRQEGGAGVLMQMGLDRFNKKQQNIDNLVVGSLRTTGEIDVLHEANGQLIFLDADRKTRYDRLHTRNREDDDIDFDMFVEQEEAELHESDDPAKFNLLGVKDMADVFIENEGSLEQFYEKIDKALSLPTPGE